MAEPIAFMTGFGSSYHGPTEGQRVGNQIDTAMIFARSGLRKTCCELVIGIRID
jgi:hypothetical protein